jgi:SAM-dependent methyltransferase
MEPSLRRSGAVDISDVIIEKLRAAVADRGLRVTPLRLDLERDPLPAAQYDVIVQFNYLQRSLFEPLARALAPGGILLLETVTRAHVVELGNDFDPRFLLDTDELAASFPDLDVLRYQEGVTERAGRPRAVASLVARRGTQAVGPGRARAAG